MAGVKGRSGGQNRKTTQKLMVEGGYRSTRHKERLDLRIEPAKLVAPAHLGEVGVEAWNRIVETLPPESLSNLDYDSLVQFCDMAEVYPGLRNAYKADPIDKDVRCSYMALVAAMDKLGRQFGWTPISRAALKSPESKDVDDPFDELAKRMGVVG